MNLSIVKYIMGSLYVSSILLGNYFVIHFGILSFNIEQDGTKLFTLVAPAGVIWIGLTFSFRDLAQRFWGKYKIWFWMIVATFITYFFNETVALASVVSFVFSETVDWVIFTVWKGNLKQRIIISNVIAAPIDSFLFVVLAFGFSWEPIIGQAILKIIFSMSIIPAIPLFDNLYTTLTTRRYHASRLSC